MTDSTPDEKSTGLPITPSIRFPHQHFTLKSYISHIKFLIYVYFFFPSKEHIQSKKILFIQHQSKKEQLFKMTNHLFLKGVRLEEAFGDGFVVVWQDLQRLQSILQLY